MSDRTHEFEPIDLKILGALSEKVSKLVTDHGARLVVEVWAYNDSGPIAWIEQHPSDSAVRIRFEREVDEAGESDA